MRKLKCILNVLIALILVEFVALGLVLSGIISPASKQTLYAEQTAGVNQKIDYSFDDENQEENEKTDEAEKSSEQIEQNNQEIVSSVLNIKLTGTYLDAYNKATKNLTDSSSDRNKKLVALVGLQILQAKVIKYENELHFYSLTYSASAGTAKAKYYNLTDAIERINSGKRIYTDCFGFVRLTHSIAAYTLNKTNPGKVVGLGGLYGYVGAYTGASISSLNKLDTGTVIYDRLTGSGSSKNRHVAMFLYSNGNSVVYMDQGGVYTGTYKDSSYIYYQKSNPYKFNTFKSYC